MVSLVAGQVFRGRRPLLPARYHLMLRALSGAWVSFAPTQGCILIESAKSPAAMVRQCHIS